jgi:hypothetical protein
MIMKSDEWLRIKLREAAVRGDTKTVRWLIDQSPHFAAKLAAELEGWSVQGGHTETAAVFRALLLTPPVVPPRKAIVDLTEWLTLGPMLNRFQRQAYLGGCLLGFAVGPIPSAEREFIAQMKGENRLWTVLIDESGWKVSAGHLGKPGDLCGTWLVCGYLATQAPCPAGLIVKHSPGLLPKHWNTGVQTRDIWGG